MPAGPNLFPHDTPEENFDKLNLFLSTLFGGKSPKIRFNSKTLTWNGASTDATALVTHGCGTTPISVQVTPDSGNAPASKVYAEAVGSATFTIRAIAPSTPANGTTQTVYWLCLG